MTSVCSISGCEFRVDSVGYCAMHYSRLRKHGDPLGGPPFKARRGEIGLFLEKAFAYAGEDCLLWPFARNSAGYGHFSYNGKDKLASRHVCEAVNGSAPEDLPEAAHTCGNGHMGCVNGRHLAWKDRSGNASDMTVHGTSQSGAKMWMAKLTEADVLAIRASDESAAILADRFAVSRTNILSVRRRKTWKHLAERGVKFSEDAQRASEDAA